MQFTPTVKSTALWYLEWQIRICVHQFPESIRVLYFPWSWILTRQLAVQVFSHTHTTPVLKTTKQKAASPGPAGTVSAACHETSIEFTGVWYLNESLKSGSQWDEQYLQCAALPVTHWAKFEISVYWSRAHSESCQHSTLQYSTVCMTAQTAWWDEEVKGRRKKLVSKWRHTVYYLVLFLIIVITIQQIIILLNDRCHT